MNVPVDFQDGRGIHTMPANQLDGPYYHMVDNEVEHTWSTEWKYDGQVVHRSVHITLKRGLGIEAHLGQLGG